MLEGQGAQRRTVIQTSCQVCTQLQGKEVSEYRVHFKSGPGNRGRSARGTSHMASLEFPPETGLILRCAGKAGNPFQRKQGTQKSPDTPGSLEGNTEGPGIASSEPLLPS